MSTISARCWISAEPLGDRMAAESVFARLADLPAPFLLSGKWSVSGDETWTIIGAEPFGHFQSAGMKIEVGFGPKVTVFEADPLTALSRFLATSADAPRSLEWLPFCGGAVGFFSYELGQTIEPAALLDLACDHTSHFPDIRLCLYDTAVAIDGRGDGWLVQTDLTGDAHEMARKRSDWLSRLAGCAAAEFAEGPTLISERTARSLPWDSVSVNMSPRAYRRAVRRIQEYIAAGDVYQVNFARRLAVSNNGPVWEVFRRLRAVNPAPYSCFLPYPDFAIVSASPEMFLSFAGDTRFIETKPIKGTRPRGATISQDLELEDELRQSAKDQAENVMIVDMLRNDLGRVADFGSVRVSRLFDIEKHPSVFQMVSTVQARVMDGLGPADVLRACFPGGSITGAPKVRAMQIIQELEPDVRGPYTGCAGFIDVRGNMLLNILIRTIVIRDGTAYFHAGGGILADSDPSSEYLETQYKAAGLLKALLPAGGGGGD